MRLICIETEIMLKKLYTIEMKYFGKRVSFEKLALNGKKGKDRNDFLTSNNFHSTVHHHILLSCMKI